MVQRTFTKLFDDYDNDRDADCTIKFGYKSIWYEIDLSAENAKPLLEELEKAVGHGHQLAPNGRRINRDAEPTESKGAAKKKAVAPRQRQAEPEQATNGAKRTDGYKRTELKPGVDDSVIRKWAKDKGIPVSNGGRLKQAVRDRYAAEVAHAS